MSVGKKEKAGIADNGFGLGEVREFKHQSRL